MIIIAYPATRCAGAGAVAVVFWMTYAPLLSKLRDRVSERLSKLIAAMMIAIGIRDDPRVDLIAQTRSRLVFTHPV